MTDQALQALLGRLDQLTGEFRELRDGLHKAVRHAVEDPEMSLTRSRKVLEYVIRDVYRRRFEEEPGTRPLENLQQRLVKEGHLPKKLWAYANAIRELGNVGTHAYGEEVTAADAHRSLTQLAAVLEWYFESERPEAVFAGDSTGEPPSGAIDGGEANAPAPDVYQSGPSRNKPLDLSTLAGAPSRQKSFLPPSPPATHPPQPERRFFFEVSLFSKSLLKIGLSLMLVVLIGGGYLYWQKRAETMVGDLIGRLEADKGSAAMKPGDVLDKYGGAVVKIYAAWRLVAAKGRGLVYHGYVIDQGQPKALYTRLPDGEVEPYLTLNSNPPNVPIGGSHSGTGFAASTDGLILTSRRVAAAWETPYLFPPSADNGVLVERGPDGKMGVVGVISQAPRDWVPGRRREEGIAYEARNDRLEIAFRKSDRRVTATLMSVAEGHDAALIRADTKEPLPSVELNDNYDSVRVGEIVYVLGYPASTPPVFAAGKDASEGSVVFVLPEPTVAVGNIGLMLRDEVKTADTTPISPIGDAYQLNVITTGAGNSGGPVFDDGGRVIGIFYAGRGAEPVSFIVPIRYGIELLGNK